MLFVIHALDRPGALPVRLANYDAHKAYLTAIEGEGVKTLMSGPLVEDDGQAMKGSLFVVDVADRAAAESFHNNDPFFTALPNIVDADDFYELLLDAHAGLSDHESQLVNVKLVLLLANQLGDIKVLRTCIEAARPDGSPR